MVLSSWSRGIGAAAGFDRTGKVEGMFPLWLECRPTFPATQGGIAGTFCAQGTKYVPKIKNAQAGAGAFLFSEYQIHEDNRRGFRTLFLDAYQ